MTTTEPLQTVAPQRPKRADARRNFDKVIAAARDAFTEDGAETSLEGIARRAGVGIGTLYRNFPTRQALLEAVYVEEVAKMCGMPDEVEGLDPWDALSTWLHRFVGYMATKHALANELLDYVDHGAPVFQVCRRSLFEAGEPLLVRAQEAGEVRPDTNLAEVIQLVGGIAKIQGAGAEQIDHLLEIALDGLRCRPA